MFEQNPEKRGYAKEMGLEEQLAAYYGSALKEQPLSQTAWYSLQQRLGSQRPKRRVSWKHLLRRRQQHFVPYYIQQSFERIAFDAHYAYMPSLLLCSFRERRREPALRLPLLPRKRFALLLPLSAIDTMDQSALETLLATGLARSRFTRRRGYIGKRVLSGSPSIVSCLLLLILGMHALWLIGIPIAIVCWYVSWWLLRMQKRKMILECDIRAVQWLGRDRICQGLHALADSSSTPYRRKWGELALAERIEHVCGTRVTMSNDSLTFVR